MKGKRGNKDVFFISIMSRPRPFPVTKQDKTSDFETKQSEQNRYIVVPFSAKFNVILHNLHIDHFKLLEYGFIYVMPAKGGLKSQSCQVLLNQLRQGTYLGDFYQIRYDKVW